MWLVGNLRLHVSAYAQGALDFNPSTNQTSALVHADHPKAATFRRRLAALERRVKARAIVEHLEFNAGCTKHQADRHRLGVRVTPDVVQRLLGDAKDGELALPIH